jgi:hypothetical protein
MFGNAITDGTQVALGTYGYVVSFDLTAYEVRSIEQIQMQSATNVLSTPSVTPETREELFALCENTQTTKDFGYFLDDSTLFVFCRTAKYAYVGTVRIGWWLKRYSIDMATAAATIDTAQDKEQLLRCLTLEAMYISLDQKTPYDIANTIRIEKTRLGV